MNRTLIASAVAVLIVAGCETVPPSDTAKECDVVQTAYEQQIFPADFDGDGWVVVCVATALVVSGS